MQSLKNTKSKPAGRPPKMIKPYRYSKRNTAIFLAIVILGLIVAFKLGAKIGSQKGLETNTTVPAEVSPTPVPSILSCDEFTSQITDGKITKTCIDPSATPTPKPSPKPAKQSLKPSDEEIVAYIRSKDWDDSTAVRVAKSENFFNLTGHFDCTRRGLDNSDGTHDRGIFQLNTIHTQISDADAYDCFKNIDWAYEIYKARGNWSAWSAYLNNSYLAHSDTL